MRKRILLLVIGLLVLPLSACAVGSRRVVTDTREVRNFDALDFGSIGDLTITQGDHESLTIEAESNITRRIRTQVRSGVLYIDMRTNFPWIGGVVPTKPIRYDLTVRELTGLDLSGVGNITAGGIDTDRLNVNLSGGGQIVMRSLTAESLMVDHTGVGRCELSGKVRSQEILLTGAGEYDAADLESETVEIEVTGVGKATVWASERLDIKLSGAGSVGYYGDPRVTRDVSGVGSVRSLGSR